MIRTTRTLIGAAVLVAASSFITTRVVSQHDAAQPDPADMMQVWMELAQPGAEHVALAQLVGTWEQENLHWMFPGAEPIAWRSTAEMTPILGGRFIMEKIDGVFEMHGQAFDFQGYGIFGYDKLKKKHTFAWMDNMGTMMMLGEGTMDEDGSITYLSEMPDPMTGGTMHFKTVCSFDAETQRFEMHQQQPDGSWFQSMDVVSKRK